MPTQPPISRNPAVHGGAPCFTNTCVPVKSLFDALRTGRSLYGFLVDFPTVTREDAEAVLDRANEFLTTDQDRTLALVEKAARKFSDASAARDATLPELKLMNHEAVVAALTVFLVSSSTSFGCFDVACSLLSEFDPENALALIVRFLRDPNFEGSSACVAVISHFGAERAMPHLIRTLLEDSDGGVRYEAARQLGWIGDGKALTPLRHAVENDVGGDFEGRMVAFEATDSIMKIFSRIYPIDREYSDQEILDLVKGLRSLDLDLVFDAEARLKSVDKTRLLQVLHDLSARPDPGSRVEAADAFTLIDGEHGVEHLLPLLNDSDPRVSKAAIYLFARLNLPSTTSSLLIPKLQSDPDPSVRKAAADVLGTSGDAEAIPVLRALAEDKQALGDPEQGFGFILTRALSRLLERYELASEK